MAVQIQLRRDTLANWTSVNPTLASGEIGIVTDFSPEKFKIGDGVTAFLSLPYAVTSTPSGGSSGDIQYNDGSGGFAGSATTITSGGSVTIPAGQTLDWSTDTGLSRLGGGWIGVGDGTQGSYSGTLKTTIINAVTGFQINGGASSGYVLRGNATNFVSAQLAFSDLASGQAGLAQGGTAVDNTSITTNYVFAGPTGPAGNATFRALVTADMPVGTGTVTSVSFTGDGTVLSSTPSSAVTTSGSVIATLAVAAAGTILGNATSSSHVPTYTSTPILGASGTLGSLTMGNATSGLLTLEPAAGALGMVTVLIPAASDTLVNLASTQALTNKTLDGVTPTTMGYLDATSSIQTQLNAKGTVSSVSLTGDGTVVTTGPTAAVTTSGTLTVALAHAAAHTIFGNTTAGSAVPAYSTAPSCTSLTLADTAANTDLSMANVTAAVLGTNQNSPLFKIAGTYFGAAAGVAAASAADYWTIQDITTPAVSLSGTIAITTIAETVGNVVTLTLAAQTVFNTAGALVEISGLPANIVLATLTGAVYISATQVTINTTSTAGLVSGGTIVVSGLSKTGNAQYNVSGTISNIVASTSFRLTASGFTNAGTASGDSGTVTQPFGAYLNGYVVALITAASTSITFTDPTSYGLLTSIAIPTSTPVITQVSGLSQLTFQNTGARGGLAVINTTTALVGAVSPSPSLTLGMQTWNGTSIAETVTQTLTTGTGVNGAATCTWTTLGSTGGTHFNFNDASNPRSGNTTVTLGIQAVGITKLYLSWDNNHGEQVVSNDGITFLTGGPSSAGLAAGQLIFQPLSSITNQSGSPLFANFGGAQNGNGFSPSSGTANYTHVSIAPTINQTAAIVTTAITSATISSATAAALTVTSITGFVGGAKIVVDDEAKK